MESRNARGTKETGNVGEGIFHLIEEEKLERAAGLRMTQTVRSFLASYEGRDTPSWCDGAGYGILLYMSSE